MRKHKGLLAVIIIVAVILVDQALKFWVKTHFYLGEDLRITDWFHLLFVENNGMAFGMEIGGKLFLTLFRIVAVGLLGWYIVRQIRRGCTSTGFIVCLALITAGAAGNIFDSLFYGLIFNDPPFPFVAEFLPDGGGYAPLFYGKVVDMFYFPLFSFVWPSWIPFVGGEEFLFFQPVFNFADAAISVGVIAMLIFYNRYLSGSGSGKDAKDEKTCG
ncbi:MAG: lipoprotein signal peptidase [Clostridium sp.]|nr:lipoprotein signal peptidase [Clostridium sp.]